VARLLHTPINGDVGISHNYELPTRPASALICREARVRAGMEDKVSLAGLA
jgi:hypothetical protein